jgi:hypothetical protein
MRLLVLVQDTKKTCGSCTNDCSTLPNVAVAICTSPGSGTCGITSCKAGFANCGDTASNGCEVNLVSEEQMCSEEVQAASRHV